MLERAINLKRGWGVDVEWGVATFLLFYSSVQSYLLWVCVGGGWGGGVRFPLYLLDFQSFELAMQDSHPSL